MTLREQLLDLAEPRYRDFIMPLMPGVDNVIGIRLPLLRKIAREIVRGDWREFLTSAQNHYFEERMLQGMVIGYAPCAIEDKLPCIARFVPKIDNWAVCDSFCWRLKPDEREAMWQFIQPYFRSQKPYDLRFAVVMGLSNFVDAQHLNAFLEQLNTIRSDAYYTRMGVAWAVSICFVKFPEPTLAWLHHCRLDDWTFNKSLQKIVESLRVDATTKVLIRTMKRRAK